MVSSISDVRGHAHSRRCGTVLAPVKRPGWVLAATASATVTKGSAAAEHVLSGGGYIIVRTVAFGVVARSAVDQKVAFEVDDVDVFLEAGWGVLVR